MHGFPFCCISLGLIYQKRPVLGVVYNPFIEYLVRPLAVFYSWSRSEVDAPVVHGDRRPGIVPHARHRSTSKAPPRIPKAPPLPLQGSNRYCLSSITRRSKNLTDRFSHRVGFRPRHPCNQRQGRLVPKARRGQLRSWRKDGAIASFDGQRGAQLFDGRAGRARLVLVRLFCRSFVVLMLIWGMI